ncbi:MAG: hypothetical protein F4Y54_02545 [Dehalococcoidia bacterium]|nr:hypothetical protein [Dehalococcoidia bacterium]
MPNDDQAGMWDVDITTPELAAHIDTMEEHREARTAYDRAYKAVKEAIGLAHERIRDTVGADAYEAGGARVRIGGFVYRVGVREGGDIAIEPWKRDAAILGKPKPIAEDGD